MLIILIGALLFGGSAAVLGSFGTGHTIDELQARVKRVVKEPDRAQAAHRVLEQWKAESKIYEKATAQSHESILKLARRHDATRAEVDAANRATDATDAQAIERYVAVRQALKEHLNSDEWAAVFSR
jgi:hypothetical protein